MNAIMRHGRIWVLCFTAILALGAIVVFAHEQSGKLTVAFLDVGQGDAVFIEGPNGNQILYDAGPPSGAVLRALSDVMKPYDRSIDVIVQSHPDLDHTGGFVEVLRRYHVSVAIEPGAFSGNGAYEAVENEITQSGVARIIARRGMRIELGEGAYADIFYPDRDMANMETNDASIVLRVVYGKTAFLLSGDLPTEEESTLARIDGKSLAANVLKAGHYGSRTSTGELWLSAVSPEVVVISSGKDNSYGHPHKETLDLLNERHIPYLLTANEGTIIFASDGIRVTKQ